MTEATLDLSDCDQEPIHIPGSIQPHGLVLVAEIATLVVVAGAGAIEERLAREWMGRPLDELLGQDAGRQLAVSATEDAPLVLDRPVETQSERFDAICHRAGDRVLIELDPAAGRLRSAIQMLAELEGYVRGFERAPTLGALCERAAVVFRSLTGFDRVMIYRFLDDGAGRVVGEDRDKTLASYLNHHFPGSDIPRQARALYVRNRARAIPDVDYAPAPMRPAGFEQLDLSDVGLRSVSPIHLQYLRNMGVKASASFSIVCDGLLWGLVACHHDSPRRVSRETLVTGIALANALARQVQSKVQAVAYDERLRLRLAVDELADQFSDDRSVGRIFEDIAEPLRRAFGADGFAFFADDAVRVYGIGPDEAALAKLAAWALEHSGGEPVATRHLSDLYPPAFDWPERASGLLMLPVRQERQALLWLRAEQPEEVRWAGDPHTGAKGDEGTALTPRASFATWVEMVHGRSRAWSLEEIDGGRRLLHVYIQAQATHRIRQLNLELQGALTERDALLKQKDLLMREVDHRVQNSLALVGAYLSLQAREAGPGPVAGQLAEAQARLSAVSLVHRRLYRADQRETIDLSQYLGDLLGDLRTALGAEWGPCIQAELAPILLPSDRAMPVGMVMTELVINAAKYAYRGKPGPVDVRLSRYEGTIRLVVADLGLGRKAVPRSESGFGHRMIIATVARLGGTLEYEDPGRGLKVTLSAPIEA
jgi:light-regulated signal transduction histidine kinase (bacteriophytochrome)